jgi:4-diphosphocytidyl-2-C-methyl-D-erythritol kinase
MTRQVSYPSYGKINLGLEIIGMRPDGYHEILTIFQTVKLSDTISVYLSREIEVLCDNPDIPQGEGNIAYKAAEALKKKCGYSGGAMIDIKKKIPSGAGMGGGSSNAAVVLIALNKLWKTNLPVEELVETGGDLGADIPFFFTGGTALGSGKGEKIIPLDDLDEMEALLAVPNFKVSTPDAYLKTDKLLTTKNRANNILAFLRRKKGFSSLTNDFELFLFPEFPILEGIAKSFTSLGALKTGVTGSGSVVFGLFRAGAGLEAIVPQLIAKFPAVNFILTATLGRVEYQGTLRLT